ncbi:SocA family protein [Rhizobium leguminosarum]|nr:SocA family protein [Rhizobium leguminosarum]
MVRFKFDWQKTIEAIEFIARQEPGITQYYIGKILFFADREHVLDYGRPITGDKYVAMEYGPVPSGVRDLLKFDSGFPDEILDELQAHIGIEHEGNKQRVYSKSGSDLPKLSGSDKTYLIASIRKYAKMSFPRLKDVSHEDVAYNEAWDRPGNANEMNIELWLEELDDPQAAKAQINEYANCAA